MTPMAGRVPLDPYRKMPVSFPDNYVREGWDGICDVECAHNSTVQAWIREYDRAALAEGRPLLSELRREWLERDYAENRGGRRIPGRRPRARAYVLGVKLPAVNVVTEQE